MTELGSGGSKEKNRAEALGRLENLATVLPIKFAAAFAGSDELPACAAWATLPCISYPDRNHAISEGEGTFLHTNMSVPMHMLTVCYLLHSSSAWSSMKRKTYGDSSDEI